MTNALWLDNLDIIRFEDVKRRRIFYTTCRTVPECCPACGNTSIYRHGMARRREGFRAYVRSDAFLGTFNGLDPKRRLSALRASASAETFCEANAPNRLVKPKPIDANRAQKTTWSDPVMLAKLANAFVPGRRRQREGCQHPRGDGRFSPAGQKTAPGRASNGPSPESLLAGRRVAVGFGGTSPRGELGSPASRVLRRLSVSAGDALSVTHGTRAKYGRFSAVPRFAGVRLR